MNTNNNSEMSTSVASLKKPTVLFHIYRKDGNELTSVDPSESTLDFGSDGTERLLKTTDFQVGALARVTWGDSLTGADMEEPDLEKANEYAKWVLAELPDTITPQELPELIEEKFSKGEPVARSLLDYRKYSFAKIQSMLNDEVTKLEPEKSLVAAIGKQFDVEFTDNARHFINAEPVLANNDSQYTLLNDQMVKSNIQTREIKQTWGDHFVRKVQDDFGLEGGYYKVITVAHDPTTKAQPTLLLCPYLERFTELESVDLSAYEAQQSDSSSSSGPRKRLKSYYPSTTGITLGPNERFLQLSEHEIKMLSRLEYEGVDKGEINRAQHKDARLMAFLIEHEIDKTDADLLSFNNVRDAFKAGSRVDRSLIEHRTRLLES
ncbi:uncharacterized protein L201_000730 [Kwoniella dendrophila CBS 6074]|uniref:Uncharacterized protein n=1 Tax=Kwoniella dendrophila CBS 6074 TaxID=1295534 RepID=A0AAX4JLR3_9TREE